MSDSVKDYRDALGIRPKSVTDEQVKAAMAFFDKPENDNIPGYGYIRRLYLRTQEDAQRIADLERWRREACEELKGERNYERRQRLLAEAGEG